jgi:hypothetical protein
MLDALHADLSVLLYPSEERALALNKAYKLTVDEQSFKWGRDAVVKPPVNIHEEVEPDQPTGIEDMISGSEAF